MRLLLDTHIFLWYISNDKRLSEDNRNKIRDGANEVYVSVVSFWEAMIKYRLGKLHLPEPPETYLPGQRERHQLLSLPLYESSISLLSELPSYHRDPFDRMLICQAHAHGLVLLTDDEIVGKYLK